MNPPQDHHLVLRGIQGAPDLFSFSDNQTQWGHTHCCPFSGTWFRCFLFFLFVSPGVQDGLVVIQHPQLCFSFQDWPDEDTFSTCFWLNLAVLFHVILPALKTKFLYYDTFCLPLCTFPFHWPCYLSLVTKSHFDFRASSMWRGHCCVMG